MLDTAVEAAHLAGRRMLSDLNTSKVSIKNKNELVTETDSACQKIIIEHIKKTFPRHGFIGEEGPRGGLLKESGPEPFYWVIDPIDGTNNFVHKIPSFAVSIGLMHEAVPVAGVIFEPNTNTIFTATAGGDACCNGVKMDCGKDPINEFASIAIDSNLKGGLHPGIIEMMLRTRFRNIGSTALHLCYVAKGSLVGTVLVGPKLWDFAAGILIAQRAGAIVTDWQGKPILPVDCENYEGESFKILAANPMVHGEMIEFLKK